MIGRGSRTAPGKQVFTVLDYGGNYERHGLWDSEIDWQKKWNQKPKNKKEGVAPVKLCPKFAKCMNYAPGWLYWQQKELKEQTSIIKFHDQIIR